MNALTGAEPGSLLDPATAIDQVPLQNEQGAVVGADLYVKPARFPSIFAAGIPAERAAGLSAGQRPLSFSALGEPSTGPTAWSTIPSWAVLGTADKVIPPAEQQYMAARAGARITTVDAPHLSMVASPGVVTDVITAAARK